MSHLRVAIRVVKYIKKKPGVGILLSASNDFHIRAYCDLDRGTCVDTRRSVSGHCVMIGKSRFLEN